MASHVGRSPDVEIAIEKSIPVAGGMAGGSADAARCAGGDEPSLGGRRAPPRPACAGGAAGKRNTFRSRCTAAPRWARGCGQDWQRYWPAPRFIGCSRSRPVACPRGAVFTEIDRLRNCRQLSRLDDPEPLLAALAAGDADELAPLLGNDLQAAAISLGRGPAPHIACRHRCGRACGHRLRLRPDLRLPVFDGGICRGRRHAARRRRRLPDGPGGQRSGLRCPGSACARHRSVTQASKCGRVCR